jgi:hypothetical protein
MASGLEWSIPSVHGKRAIRHVIYDTNWWKSFIYARLAVAIGDRGCLSLFGNNPEPHRMLAEQLTAERNTTSRRKAEAELWMSGNLDPTSLTITGWTALWELPWLHQCKDVCSLERMAVGASNGMIALVSRNFRRRGSRDCAESDWG